MDPRGHSKQQKLGLIIGQSGALSVKASLDKWGVPEQHSRSADSFDGRAEVAQGSFCREAWLKPCDKMR